MALFGVGGAAGAVLVVVLVVVSIMLALAPLFIAHALYQIGGALRLHAFLMHPKAPDEAFLAARRTPMMSAVGVILACVLVGIAAVGVLIAAL